jgi:hypothetical protein
MTLLAATPRVYSMERASDTMAVGARWTSSAVGCSRLKVERPTGNCLGGGCGLWFVPGSFQGTGFPWLKVRKKRDEALLRDRTRRALTRS